MDGSFGCGRELEFHPVNITKLVTDCNVCPIQPVGRGNSEKPLVWLKPQPNGDVPKDREVFHNVER